MLRCFSTCKQLILLNVQWVKMRSQDFFDTLVMNLQSEIAVAAR